MIPFPLSSEEIKNSLFSVSRLFTRLLAVFLLTKTSNDRS